MEDSSGSETSDPLLHRVLSASLDAEKSWFALNSVKCWGKPSRFSSSGFAQVFPDEYRQIALDDLLGCDGFPAPASWFSAASRRAENVYVASAFGLVVELLRQKTLDAPFFQTEDFQLISAWINGFSLSGAASTNFPPPPPSTPSPPKPNRAPFPQHNQESISKRKRSLNELRADEVLSPAFKKKKMRETVVNLLNQITGVCERNGESLSIVPGEC